MSHNVRLSHRHRHISTSVSDTNRQILKRGIWNNVIPYFPTFFNVHQKQKPCIFFFSLFNHILTEINIHSQAAHFVRLVLLTEWEV